MASSSSASSLKYPYPAEVSVRDSVRVILCKKNYFVWKKQMLLLFEFQGLVGFINGEVVAPPEKKTVPNDDVNSPNGTKEMLNQDYQDWKRLDTLLQRWIIGTISEDFLSHLVCLKTAKDMWSNLTTLLERKLEYPYPEEINVRDFVPNNLSKYNYFRWKTFMHGLIESQGLIGFINGEVSAPPEKILVPNDSIWRPYKEIENQDYQHWKRSDALLQKWITETINEDIIREVVCWKTAKDMWSKLIILGERKMEYPYRPVDINVTDFVPIQLSNENYSIWKTLMVGFIESQGLLGFINGEVTKPAFSEDNSNDNNDEWRRSDELLQLCIKKTINEDIRGELVLLETSKDIWERLTIMHESNIVYPYPIDVNVGDFVPLKLSGSNYDLWKTLMLHLFENQGLLAFINMAIPRAADSFLAWKRTDALLQSWIRRTISETFVAHVVDTKTASDMWTKLETLCTSETTIEYPYPVEVNVGDYVPVKLSRENYSMWAKLMLRLFKSQGLDDFIKGRVPQPKSREKHYKAWKRTDGLLQSWMTRTINAALVAHVVDAETASDMWTKLEEVVTLKTSNKRRQTENENEDEDAERENVKKYRAMHKATLRGNWDKAKELLEQDHNAVRADITGLMVAVRSQRRNHFVKNLLEFTSPDEDMTVRNHNGQTSLHLAATAGNLEAAKLLVYKNLLLPNISDFNWDISTSPHSCFTWPQEYVSLLTRHHRH